MTTTPPSTILRRILSRIVETDSGCWVYTGASSQGYGHAGVDGRTVDVHRLTYSILVGPIPEGLDIDHLCRVRACCNPAHLEPVTRRENLLRGAGCVAELRTHCRKGLHEFTPENTRVVSARGTRECRECSRAAYRARYHRLKTELATR